MTETMIQHDPSKPVRRHAPLEKIALETYVPPAKPSLVGLSRAEIADQLGAIGVAPAQRKMRVQQLWHWIYVRGAQNFDEMTSISKEMRDELDDAFHRGAARSGRRADLQRRHPQMAAAPAERRLRSRRRMKSSASIFRKPTAARCAFPRRSAAR